VSAEAIAALRAAYPRQDFPDSSVRLYARMLGDLPDREVADAIGRIIRRSTWLPSIAEIRRDVADHQLQLPPPHVAWEIARTGSLAAAPPEVRHAVEAVGGRWQVLHSERPDMTRRAFIEEYERRRDLAIQEIAGSLAVPLVPPATPALAAVPVTDKVEPRPIVRYWMRRMTDRDAPPTDAEKRDAIVILRDDYDETEPDPLYIEAERMLAQWGA
jgi:hypothetical protein